MKLKFYIFLITLLLFPFKFTFSQEDVPRTKVSIIPMINTEKDDRYNIICSTITDNIELTLNSLTKFDVLITKDLEPYKKPHKIKFYAEKNRIDNIIFGKLYLSTEGYIVLQLSLYDRITGKVTKTIEERAESIFEIFDITEVLMVKLVEAFNLFGTLRLVNTGEEGEFEVYINGEPVGKNIYELEKTLIGALKIEIKQKRMLKEVVIFSKDTEIYEGKTTKLEFGIPYLLKEEKDELEWREKIIKEKHDIKQDRDIVKKQFKELLGLLENVTYCYRLKEVYNQYKQMELEYMLPIIRWDIEDIFFDVQRKKVDEIFSEIARLHIGAQSLPVRSEIRDGIIKNANFLYNILGLHAAYSFALSNWDRGEKLYREIERMSRIVPAEYYYNFEEEKEFVFSVYDEYHKKLKKGKKGEANQYIKNEFTNYFGRRIHAVDKLLRNPNILSGNELIVITNPIGMRVYVDGQFKGNSPVRVIELEKKRFKVEAKDSWFVDTDEQFILEDRRNYIVMNSTWKLEPWPFDYKRPEVYTALIKQGRKHELSWKKTENAVSYIIGIDEIGKDESKSIYKKIMMKQNHFMYNKILDEEKDYNYRVCSVNKNDIKSPWSDKAGFEGKPKWSFKTGGSIESSPAVGPDNTIYIGSSDGNLYAVNADGTLKWSFKTRGAVYSSPAIGKYGNIYFGSNDCKVYALDPDGTLFWSFETSGEVYSTPAIGNDETLYFCSWDGNLYALDLEGRLKWRYFIGNRITSSPAIDANGIVYIGNCEGTLYSFHNNGSIKWKINTKCPVLSTPAIGSDGTIYIGSKYGSLLAVDQNGSIKWNYKTGEAVQASPAIGQDGTIYIGNVVLKSNKKLENKLFVLTPDGKLKWQLSSEGSFGTSPAVGSDGIIYIGSSNGNIFAINSNGKVKWSHSVPGAISCSPCVSKDGSLYIGSSGTYLYALNTSSKGIALSPWPMVGKDTKHTHSAQTAEDEPKIPYRIISVDGDISDWYGIKPIITDPAFDDSGSYTGTDIKNIYLAVDSTKIYTRIDLTDDAPNMVLPAFYAIGLESQDDPRYKNATLLIQYDKKYTKRWHASVRTLWVDENEGDYRTAAIGNVSTGDSYLEAVFPLIGLGIPFPTYINAHSWCGIQGQALDMTDCAEAYLPKEKITAEEIRRRWLFSISFGPYYGYNIWGEGIILGKTFMHTEGIPEDFDIMFGINYSFGGNLFWGLNLGLHPNISSLSLIYFKNYDKIYHFFDLMIIPESIYTFGYGIGIKHLLFRAKLSYLKINPSDPYSIGIYTGFLF